MSLCEKGAYLPVDESVAFLGLLKEMHELQLAFRQVKPLGSVHSISKGSLGLVLCQALVGVHNFETHLAVVLLFFFWRYGLVFKLCLLFAKD